MTCLVIGIVSTIPGNGEGDKGFCMMVLPRLGAEDSMYRRILWVWGCGDFDQGVGLAGWDRVDHGSR